LAETVASDKILRQQGVGSVTETEANVEARRAMAQLLAENEGLRAALDDMRARVDELERLADTDTLTPLPNRRVFVREVERVARQVARYATPAAVVFIDVNGLKSINDAYGHQAGDAALIHVATVLKRETRATDVVARIGGDEFGLLLDRLELDAATAKAEALILAFIESPLDLGAKQLTVGLSLGLTMIGPTDSVDSILARADAEMYAAKAAQRSER
jgi:diguanylate cyclase (GGDEF)-like protein